MLPTQRTTSATSALGERRASAAKSPGLAMLESNTSCNAPGHSLQEYSRIINPNQNIRFEENIRSHKILIRLDGFKMLQVQSAQTPRPMIQGSQATKRHRELQPLCEDRFHLRDLKLYTSSHILTPGMRHATDCNT